MIKPSKKTKQKVANAVKKLLNVNQHSNNTKKTNS